MANGNFNGFEASDIDHAIFGKALVDPDFRSALLAKVGSGENPATEAHDDQDVAYVESVLARSALPHDGNTAREIIDLREMGAEESFNHLQMQPGAEPPDPTAAFG